MFIEMSCNCEASFQFECEDNDTLALVWAHSFVNAHTDCGFMTKGKSEAEEKFQRSDVIYKEEREKEL
jgi:hypothetical protein